MSEHRRNTKFQAVITKWSLGTTLHLINLDIYTCLSTIPNILSCIKMAWLSANYWWKMNVFLFHKWLFEKAVLLWLVLLFKQVATTAVHITEVMNFFKSRTFSNLNIKRLKTLKVELGFLIIGVSICIWHNIWFKIIVLLTILLFPEHR